MASSTGRRSTLSRRRVPGVLPDGSILPACGPAIKPPTSFTKSRKITPLDLIAENLVENKNSSSSSSGGSLVKATLQQTHLDVGDTFQTAQLGALVKLTPRQKELEESEKLRLLNTAEPQNKNENKNLPGKVRVSNLWAEENITNKNNDDTARISAMPSDSAATSVPSQTHSSSPCQSNDGEKSSALSSFCRKQTGLEKNALGFLAFAQEMRSKTENCGNNGSNKSNDVAHNNNAITSGSVATPVLSQASSSANDCWRNMETPKKPKAKALEKNETTSPPRSRSSLFSQQMQRLLHGLKQVNKASSKAKIYRSHSHVETFEEPITSCASLKKLETATEQQRRRMSMCRRRSSGFGMSMSCGDGRTSFMFTAEGPLSIGG